MLINYSIFNIFLILNIVPYFIGSTFGLHILNSPNSNRNVRQITKSTGTCVSPPQPEHGKYVGFPKTIPINPGQAVDEGTTIVFSCNDNYTLSTLKALDPVLCFNGVWIQDFPTCIKTCPPRISDSVINTCTYDGKDVNCSLPVLDGTRLKMECKLHYESSDLSVKELQSVCVDGSWDQNIMKCVPACGKLYSQIQTFIIGGSIARSGAFPWHVSVFMRDDEFEFICSGSLIAMNIVLSAATCFTDINDGGIHNVSRYAIAAGKHYRSLHESRDEATMQLRNIKHINITERYKGMINNYIEDIAIIVLEEPFTVSHMVQPVCVDWKREYTDEQLQAGSYGDIVGFGFTEAEGSPSDELKHLRMPVIGTKQCYDVMPNSFYKFITSDKFCAGYTNGSGMCKGDSGSGLVFLENSRHRYYIQGLTSVGPQKGFGCDPDKYTLFTKISPFLKLITQVVAENKLRKGCTVPEQPQHGQYVASPKRIGLRPGQIADDGTALSYTCENNYELSSKRSLHTVLCFNGIWTSDFPTCIYTKCKGNDECKDGSSPLPEPCDENSPNTETCPLARNHCIIPNHPKHGKFTTLSPNLSAGQIAEEGTVLTYICDRNYGLNTLEKVEHVICYNKMWNKQFPICLRTCPEPSESVSKVCEYEDRKISCSSPMIHGVRVRTSCNFVSVDSVKNSVMVCRNGLWDQEVVKCALDCGRPAGEIVTLIIKGLRAKRGLFPWHVAIYRKSSKEGKFSYICGGSLIKMNVVLSAAHCFADDNGGELYDTSLYTIAAGKYYRKLDHPNDTQTQQNRNIKNVIVDENYKGLLNYYRDDIAIVILEKPFQITLVVRPVCIDWDSEYEDEQLQTRAAGDVVGWGYTQESGVLSNELQQLSMPYIATRQCYNVLPINFYPYITPDKFCAGYTNGSSVCLGDSGGGLVFFRNSSNTYYIRGVVSSGPAKNDNCRADKYALFTNVGKYLRHIIKTIAEDRINTE